MNIHKKGQIRTLAPAVLGLVFAAAVLVFGLIMLQELRDTDTISNSISVIITNETVTQAELTAGGSSVTLDGFVSGYCNPASASIIVIANGTGTHSIDSLNYTISSAGVLANITDTFSDADWGVTYSFTSGDEACTSANATIIGLATFADFWEIIVLAVVITIVIGLLLVVFGGRQRS